MPEVRNGLLDAATIDTGMLDLSVLTSGYGRRISSMTGMDLPVPRPK